MTLSADALAEGRPRRLLGALLVAVFCAMPLYEAGVEAFKRQLGDGQVALGAGVLAE